MAQLLGCIINEFKSSYGKMEQSEEWKVLSFTLLISSSRRTPAASISSCKRRAARSPTIFPDHFLPILIVRHDEFDFGTALKSCFRPNLRMFMDVMIMADDQC